MLLKSIGPFSCAKISGILYALMGLIIGGLFTLIALMGVAFGNAPSGALFGVGAVIILPVLYGGIGFVGGAIMAWLYNVVASWIGGIELEFEDDRPSQQNYGAPM